MSKFISINILKDSDRYKLILENSIHIDSIGINVKNNSEIPEDSMSAFLLEKLVKRKMFFIIIALLKYDMNNKVRRLAIDKGIIFGELTPTNFKDVFSNDFKILGATKYMIAA